MSRYESSSTRLALTAQVRAQWQQLAPLSVCSSSELAAAAGQVSSGSSLGVVRCVLEDEGLPQLVTASGPWAAARLQQVQTLLAGGDRGLETGRGELATAAAGLLESLSGVVARSERSIVATAAAASLADLGYTVDHQSGPIAEGVEARRENEVMLLAVTDGGVVDTDHAGVDGACDQRQAQFEAAMATRGILLTTTGSGGHSDATGPLIARAAAAAAGQRSLASAIAQYSRDGDEPVAVSRSRSRTSGRAAIEQGGRS